MTTPDCIFCKIGKGDIPAEKLFDDGTAFAIRDIEAQAPVHILVIPHAHVGALASEPPDALAAAAHCVTAAPEIASNAGLDGGGYRLIVNQGAAAGQGVPHFHLHILGGRTLGNMG
ncbi:MAG: HIT domain-containing protein [Dehalococcoidia bacterium]